MKLVSDKPLPDMDPTKDFTSSETCGCKVVFLGSCLHRTTRMDCCPEHASSRMSHERNAIHRRAKDHHAYLVGRWRATRGRQ